MIEIKSLRTAGDLESLVDEIISLRKKYRMTQKDLAHAVGISQPYMSKIEKGLSKDIPYALIVKFLSFFEINVLLGKITIHEKGK